jgi:hypothetical protein
MNEDGGHLFCKCKKVKPIWRQLQLEEIREELCSIAPRNSTETGGEYENKNLLYSLDMVGRKE